MSDADDPVAVVGFDVTALAVAELEQAGIRLAPTQHPISPVARRWLTHSEVASRYPKRDAIDRSLARASASWWAARHGGKIAGMVLARSFPCLGTYRVENADAQTGPVIVVCDVCGDRFGVRRDEFDAAFLAPPLT
jgi:hypothetical protein